MLSENQRIRGLISSVIDIVLLIAAYLLANFLRFNWLPFFEEGGAGPALDIARSPMVALGWAGYAVVMVLLYWSRGLYNPSRLRGLWQRSTTIAFGQRAGRGGLYGAALRFPPAKLLPRGHAAAVRVQHRLFDLQADDQALV